MTTKSKRRGWVTTLAQLNALALQRRSVVLPFPCGRVPAAVVISMQGRTILKYMDHGMYVYNKESGK